jgi:hypothetical protein
MIRIAAVIALMASPAWAYDGTCFTGGKNCCRNIIERINYLAAITPQFISYERECPVRFTVPTGAMFLIGWLTIIYGFGARNPLAVVGGILVCLSAYMLATSCPAGYP